MQLIYYFLLPEKFPEHLSIKLMFKLFPAYFFPNLRNAAKFSTEDLKHLIKIPGLDVAGAYQLFFSRFKKLPILDNCYLFELYRTITNFKPLPVLPEGYTKDCVTFRFLCFTDCKLMVTQTDPSNFQGISLLHNFFKSFIVIEELERSIVGKQLIHLQ